MKKILLVEDDPFLVDIYKKKLGESGFDIEVAEDGEQALKKAQEQKPDIMLLDIILPNTDGWAILRKIKENPQFKELKVIILSNLGQKDEVEKGIAMGATQYLIKAHFTPGEVAEEIKKILK